MQFKQTIDGRQYSYNYDEPITTTSEQDELEMILAYQSVEDELIDTYDRLMGSIPDRWMWE